WEIVVRPEIPAAATPSSQPQPPPAATDTPPQQPIATDLLVGEYYATKGGAFEINKTDGGGLAWVVPGDAIYPLKPSSVNVYEVTGLSGASLTFTESIEMPGRITALVRQPQVNIIALRSDASWLARAKAQYDGAEKELIGIYRSFDRNVIMEIVPYRRGV